MPESARDPAPLLMPRSGVGPLMQLYDYPHPRKPGRVIRGYDRHHALRTARMCAAVARRLGHPEERVQRYQIACLLHDLGRAGLDQELFGKIWSWARANGIPTRPREWRSEEHTSELQSQSNLVCRLLLEKKKENEAVTYSHS